MSHARTVTVRGLMVVALVVTSIVAVTARADAEVLRASIVDFSFEPPSLTVKAGDRVEWRNEDAVAHTVTAAGGSFDSGSIGAGGTFSRSFSTPGTIDYLCTIHPSMRGSVRVLSRNAVRIPSAGDRAGAALMWSRQLPAGSVDTALIGRDDVFADALASGPAQSVLDAPLLLTDRNNLSSGTRNELTRLGVSRAVILGGTGAVSAGVEAQIAEMGITTERVSGADRVATAVAVANRTRPDADAAILARAFGDGVDETRAFADALGAGAAGGHLGAPVLLTDTASLSAATRDHLRDRGISRVYIAGGTAAVSSRVEQQVAALGIEVVRVAGPGRTETSLAWVGQIWPNAGARGDVGGPHRLLLVDASSPDGWASGLAASLHAEPDGLVVAHTSLTPDVIALGLATRPQIVCGPGIGTADCDLATAVSNAPSQLDTDAVPVAVLTPTGAPDGSGDPDARPGVTNLFPTSDPRVVCAVTSQTLEDPVVAAHVHRVSDGSVVFPIATAQTLGGELVGCSTGLPAAAVAGVFDRPTDHYVNVHTESFPDGAIAGTLFDADFLHATDATGAQEVPPNDVDGIGFHFVFGRADTREVCVQSFAFQLTGPVTGSHIHAAAAGANGDVVLPFGPIVDLGPGDARGASCHVAEAGVYDAIATSPEAHYVNLHTDAHPDGEVRGQLEPTP